MMYKTQNRKTSRILCFLVIFALIVSVFAGISSSGFFAYADDTEENVTFTQTAMHPSNNQFKDTSSSDIPKTPSNWTGGGVDGLSGGKTISGVLDLSTYANDKDKYKLPEDDIINSPFGKGGANDNTNRNVLLVNIRDDGTSAGSAYGYTSSELTFSKNKFYMVKAWVRTGDFAGDSGAAIRLNGLGEDIAFTNINTVSGLDKIDSSNDFGWKDYTFYVASSSYEDKTVTLSLQVGDKYEKKFRPAKGYALFDNVTAFEIAPSSFLGARETEQTQVIDLSAHTSEDYAAYESDFAFTNGLANWQQVSADTDLSNTFSDIYDGSDLFTEDKKFGLVSDPASSLGKNNDGDSKVLVVSSYDKTKDAYKTVSKGMAFKTPIKIERYHYYRISAWIKSQKIEGGAGATFALSAIRNENDEPREGNNLFATITGCNGNADNKSRGGFEQYSFYVKGSAIKDYDAYIECWLGVKDNQSSGVAIFDNITVEEISPADYSSFNSNGTAVDFDTYNGADGNAFVTLPDTGITNGMFYNIDGYEEFSYPIAPAGWEKHTTDSVGSDGYSSETVKTEDAVSGIVPTDADTFYAYNDKFGNPTRPLTDGNVLMLYSKTPTAFCYRSSVFTASANTPGEIAITLGTQNMGADDYGASLVLKDDKRVLATIEGIKSEKFGTYKFFVEPADADVSTLAVEIWLGGNDRNQNKTKLSAGHVFVKSVSYTAFTDDKDGETVTKTAAAKFAEQKTECDAEKLGETQITKAAYSYKSVDLYAYDLYDSSFVKQPFNWQLAESKSVDTDAVQYGIFDSAKVGAQENKLVPKDFTSDKRNVLMLRNGTEAYSSLTYSGAINAKADTYYKVEVSLKVNIPENQLRKNAVGATLALTGGPNEIQFKDIKSTALKIDGYTDNEAFRTYTFFIKPNSADTSLSLRLSLGESDYNKQCSGIVYINDITYTDITEAAYGEAKNDIDDGNKFAVLADLTVEADEDDNADSDNPESTLDWWLIPSILFAVAILIAIIGFMVRKLVEKRRSKKGVVQKYASYDRTATLNREHNKNADEESEKVSTVADDDEHYEAFDDDAVQAPAKSAEQTEPEAEIENGEEQKAEETADGEQPAEQPSESDAQTEEIPQTAETPKPEQAQQKQDTSFIDRFDD